MGNGKQDERGNHQDRAGPAHGIPRSRAREPEQAEYDDAGDGNQKEVSLKFHGTGVYTESKSGSAEALVGFLHGFEVGFEGGAVLFLGFQFGLEFFYQQLETTDFVAQFLSFG